MKKGRIIFAALLALFLVVAIGLVSASMIASECDCYAGCYYCDPEEPQKCKVYDGPGACFCHENPCRLVEHFICCEQGK